MRHRSQPGIQDKVHTKVTGVFLQPGVVAHACHPTTSEAEATSLRAQGQTAWVPYLSPYLNKQRHRFTHGGRGEETRPAYLKVVLGVLEDIVDDSSVTADVQKDSLVFPHVVDGEGTVPSERPGHALKDKDKHRSQWLAEPRAVTPRSPTLPAPGGEPFGQDSGRKRTFWF